MDYNLTIPEEVKLEIIQYLKGKLSENEATHLISWLNEHKTHKDFFDSLTGIWHSSSVLSSTPAFDSDIAWEEIYGKLREVEANATVGKTRKMIRLFAGVAAVFLLMLVSGYWVMYAHFSKQDAKPVNLYAEFSAPLGSTARMTLPDGSYVWLNSGSRIRFDNTFGTNERNLTLTGEAYFKVAKNKALPFVVHTSDVNITALGTAFNVKAYEDEPTIETTLEEGSVKIEPLVASAQMKQQLMLKPNEKAVFHKIVHAEGKKLNGTTLPEPLDHQKEDQVRLVSPNLSVSALTDTRLNTSWKEPRWIFRHESLDELAKKLERRYDVRIIFLDNSLKQYVFNGSLQEESIEQVFEVIRLIAPIDYRINHKTISLSLNGSLKEKYEKLLQP